MSRKSIKDNISKFTSCYGCGVCVNVCPVKIIRFGENCNGFYSPWINEPDKCIECGLCLKVCAYNHKEVAQENTTPKGYAAWSNDESVREKASSGGIGYEIGKTLLDSGWQAIGVKFDASLNRAVDFIASTSEQFRDSMGSKYIQTNPFPAFNEIDIKKKYLITGTPCQIDSFRRYIRQFKVEDNFVLLDFFCHGVPSLLAWDKYTRSIEKVKGPITYASWRDKRYGWHNSWAIRLETENDKNAHFSLFTQGDIFYKFFLGNLCLNRCCYKACKYKLLQSAADIRIGDLWGPTYKDDEKGVSAILVFSEKGEKIISDLKESQCTVLDETTDTVTEGQMATPPRIPRIYPYIIKALKGPLTLKTILRLIRLSGRGMYLVKKLIPR